LIRKKMREEIEKKWKKEKEEMEEKINRKIDKTARTHTAMNQRIAGLEEKIEKKNNETQEKARIGEEHLEGKVLQIERKYRRLETEERRKCIIIKGMKMEKKDMEKKLERFFKEKMMLEVNVQRARIIGRKENDMGKNGKVGR